MNYEKTQLLRQSEDEERAWLRNTINTWARSLPPPSVQRGGQNLSHEWKKHMHAAWKMAQKDKPNLQKLREAYGVLIGYYTS